MATDCGVAYWRSRVHHGLNLPVRKATMRRSLLIPHAIAYAFITMAIAQANAAEYVYVESNIKTPNGNSIYAYKRGADGRLSAVPGSPFLTGGAGVQDSSLKLGPYDSDQEMITNRD